MFDYGQQCGAPRDGGSGVGRECILYPLWCGLMLPSSGESRGFCHHPGVCLAPRPEIGGQDSAGGR